MAISIRANRQVRFLFLISLISFLLTVCYIYGTYTFSIWTRPQTESRQTFIERATRVFRVEITNYADATANSETAIRKTSKGTVEDNVANKELDNIEKQLAMASDYALKEVKTVINDKKGDAVVAENKKVDISIDDTDTLETVEKVIVETSMADNEKTENKYERLLGCRKLPDILTIGFEKCGTYTLNKFLGIHPQIFHAREENYKQFNKDSTLSVQEYTRNKTCTPLGQFRVNKLGGEGTVENTFEVIPNARILAIVKEPVERTLSHYLNNVNKGVISNQSNFDDTVAAIMDNSDPDSVEMSPLFSWSRFIERLKPWIAKYELDNIHIIDGDMFVKCPVEELQKVEMFLRLHPFITEDHFVYSDDKEFYCLKEDGGVKCMPPRKGRPHPKMSNKTRARLQSYYKPFNDELFRTLDRNFSWNY